ncbi:hypothetical protein RRU01S_14_01550 [Agrobacterium rubi TR3 = NBRC 13261]|uniref:Uncharacterized protein n=1 Tax=Agrobacterium rubi TR3 = NBRC 13261 TaxID=1368415 RepID=A0A081CW86_9HYPH|nr:ankyrin repeat domain-containing protein [Agrobacterium rubi]MBP1877895.1 hypothetical protein [Agrobacterium rubi]MCL6651919.1 hypothetical protein [Agrobacterium rubi]GAK70932.1 hypothetical protein RRU01S_14_01550 [Agrobacterium rubi TR3 = NBRC 13261]
MPKPKKKTLPKDFEDLLQKCSPDEIRDVLKTRDVNAYHGYAKRTALTFNALPDDVARWLVENGADISARDQYGETPLHARAGHWQGRVNILLELGADVNSRDKQDNTPLHKAAAVGNVDTTRALIEHGAIIDATNKRGLTPLAYALQLCTNATISRTTRIAELLIAAQPRKPTGIVASLARLLGRKQSHEEKMSQQMRDFVRRIGENFEFHRQGFDTESRSETSDALNRLYELFDVPPVPHRQMHDGVSRIVANAATWQERHQQYWEILVPSSGAASTVQGEVVRISGRISREIDGNGGINWDSEFKAMADCLLVHLGSGNALPDPLYKEAKNIISQVKRKYGDTFRLNELAVTWIDMNPNPISLPAPSYSR